VVPGSDLGILAVEQNMPVEVGDTILEGEFYFTLRILLGTSRYTSALFLLMGELSSSNERYGCVRSLVSLVLAYSLTHKGG
jgi:hypothetical protein